MNDLFVNELCADLVLFAVMPGGEDLLAEEETPGSVLFLPSSPLYFLLTLGDGIHQMLPATSQSPHLQEGSTFQVMHWSIFEEHTLEYFLLKEQFTSK